MAAGGDGDWKIWAGAIVVALFLGGGQTATVAANAGQAPAKPRKPPVFASVVAGRPVTGPGAGRATVKDPSGTGGKITPRMLRLYRVMGARGDLHGGASCWDRHEWNRASKHPKGKACDVFYNYRSASQVARGWTTARWLAAHSGEFGIATIIWQGKSWSSGRPYWKPYRSGVYHCPNPKNVTGCHYDHVHVDVK